MHTHGHTDSQSVSQTDRQTNTQIDSKEKSFGYFWFRILYRQCEFWECTLFPKTLTLTIEMCAWWNHDVFIMSVIYTIVVKSLSRECWWEEEWMRPFLSLADDRTPNNKAKGAISFLFLKKLNSYSNTYYRILLLLLSVKDESFLDFTIVCSNETITNSIIIIIIIPFE